MSEPTLEERIAKLEAEVANLPRILEEFETQTVKALEQLEQSLGISFITNKDGSWNVNIQSPSKKQFVGVLASLYWEVQALKKKPESAIIVPGSN